MKLALCKFHSLENKGNEKDLKLTSFPPDFCIIDTVMACLKVEFTQLSDTRT